MFRQMVAVEIVAYRRDAHVKCFLDSSSVGTRNKSFRGAVSSFSDRSRGRLLFTAFNASVDWVGFAVLTYPGEFSNDGRKVKRDIHTLCKRIRREFGASYLWGIEFQTRGAPHVNFLFDKFIPKDILSRWWFEIVGSGDEKHLSAGTRIEFCKSSEQAAGYMAAAYSAKKSVQKTVPEDFKNVGRFWGATRGLVVAKSQDIFLVDDALPFVRTLRKFAESGIKSRKLQPMRDEKKRKRKVKRKSTYFLHSGLQGFKVFKGAGIASRIIEGASSG